MLYDRREVACLELIEHSTATTGDVAQALRRATHGGARSPHTAMPAPA